MPPPTTSSRLQSSGNSSAPVESMTRGSSGKPGKRTDSDPAAMMHCLKSSRFGPSGGLQLQRMRADELRLAAKHIDLALLREQREAVGQFGHDSILPSAQALAVDLRRSEHDAAGRHVGGILDHLGRMQQRLRGDAAHVQAHAAEHRPAFDESDLQAQIGRAKGRRIAARACAEHDQLERARRCGGRLRRARRRARGRQPACGSRSGRRVRRRRAGGCCGWRRPRQR